MNDLATNPYDAVAYPGHWSACATVPLAHGLVQRGLLRPVFFDRMHECGGCGSRRMSAREECPACRSPELAECELIHHYHCAALLPEERFRDGARLTCPKCSQALRNYGKDYDRPGRVLACGGCARTTSEPEVGFMCLDCGRHCDGEAVRTVDIQSWHLTEAAHRLLTGAAERPEAGLDEARLGNAGRSEIERLKEAIRRSRQAGRVPSAVAQIRYAGRDGSARPTPTALARGAGSRRRFA